MRGLFWVLIIFAAAIAVAITARDNPGYVLFVLPGYRVEVSLNLFVVGTALAFVATYVLVRVVAGTLALPGKVRKLRATRRRDKARNLLLAATASLFQGRYAKAEKAATQAIDLGEGSPVGPVVAARAAHELRERDKRNAYLSMLPETSAEEAVLRRVTEAEFSLSERDPQGALGALRSLRDLLRKPHGAALRMELKALQQASNWDGVLRLLPEMQKRNALEPAAIDALRSRAHVENLQGRATSDKELKSYWDALSYRDRTDPRVAAMGARAFIQLGGSRIAGKILEDALGENWEPELVALYGDCADGDSLRHIEQAEAWLRQHPQDAVLLHALARLCMQQELWGKAQSYVDASLSVQETEGAYLTLAELRERSGKGDEACRAYRKSLELALARRARPHPAAQGAGGGVVAGVKASE